jgi:SAM-dependent methyltransferase
MRIETSVNAAPHNWLIHHLCTRAVKRHAGLLSGRVLDVGCGRKPYAAILRPRCAAYLGMDRPQSTYGTGAVDVAGDALRLPFRAAAFDAVVSFQVLEHVPEPQQFLTEVFRVLKAGGTVLLATPFLWGEHEEPHDYYRFTRYGLRYLAEHAGFEVLSIEADTGFLAMAVLRLNYWLNRLRLGPLRLLLRPLFFHDQWGALLVNRFDRSSTGDTATFFTVLRKPS